MRRLDAFLIDRLHQPICDALYQRVGDCMVIARWMMTQALGLSLCIIVAYVALGRFDWTVLFNVASHLCVIGGIIFYRSSLRYFLGRSGLNPLRYAMLLPRVYLLITMPMLSGFQMLLTVVDPLDLDRIRFAVEAVRNLVIVSGVYFAACHNMPPPRRVKAPARHARFVSES
jgi:hypothetical protein